jgi:hypothetical protein
MTSYIHCSPHKLSQAEENPARKVAENARAVVEAQQDPSHAYDGLDVDVTLEGTSMHRMREELGLKDGITGPSEFAELHHMPQLAWPRALSRWQHVLSSLLNLIRLISGGSWRAAVDTDCVDCKRKIVRILVLTNCDEQGMMKRMERCKRCGQLLLQAMTIKEMKQQVLPNSLCTVDVCSCACV